MVNETPKIAQSDIDRLIDGELSESARRDMLLHFDADPSCWRRCALAFLETQCWEESLGGLSDENSAAQKLKHHSIRSQNSPNDSRRKWTTALQGALVMMALLAAFGLGRGFREFAGPTPSALENSPPEGTAGPNNSLVENLPPPEGEQRPPTDLATTNSQPRPAEDAKPVSMVRLVGTAQLDSDAGPQAAIPVLSGPGLDEDWLRRQPPSISDDSRRELEEQGYQVHHQRRLVKVRLEDGRQLTIPLDLVSVEYVGLPIF